MTLSPDFCQAYEYISVNPFTQHFLANCDKTAFVEKQLGIPTFLLLHLSSLYPSEFSSDASLSYFEVHFKKSIFQKVIKKFGFFQCMQISL